MKLICARGALLDAINTVAGAVATRTPRPALSCMHLVASKSGELGELTIAGTDAELSLKIRLPAVSVSEAGAVLVSADKVRQIVSAEDGEETLTLEAAGNDLIVKGGGDSFRILGIPAAEFPPMPEMAAVLAGSAGSAKPKAVFAQPAGVLSEIVLKTSFATSKETSRYAINGVLLKREGRRIEMVATDGRRLALCRATVPGPAEKDSKPVQCIVPTKALSMLQKLVRTPEESVQIAVTDGQVYFAFGAPDERPRAVLSTSVVEGTFPPYEEVIPRENDKKIVFDKDVLSIAMRKAMVLTSEETRGVKMKFLGKQKKLEISGGSGGSLNMGESTIPVNMASYDGEDIEIGFNPTFFQDALKVVSEEQVILELKGPNKPGLMKFGADFLYVVMPLSVT